MLKNSRAQVSSNLSENRIEVFDASGRLVHRGVARKDEEYAFPIQTKGVYLVRVTAGSESAVCRVVAL
ncbi:MAG: T9SS type A sorting domain-containing protein [Candidatus Aegiribacteria sp.]|nr:T9SS type A sorting domain-containing protein [Candidatus Aegiribacteria sp.]MBD3294317.1 T9SS type A sorting domain-containing protein [Candidatus Fermentibacteria bacterium]